MTKQQQQRQVKTAKPISTDDTPRLPHERDESADSQSSPSRKRMEQVTRDIGSGQVDTDLHNREGGVENAVRANKKA